MTRPACPYCDEAAALVTGEKIYPHRRDLWSKFFYKCEPCAAWVGCHPDTTVALGRLANAELRQWRSKAHAAFDPIWRNSGSKNARTTAYGWLAGQLGIPANQCHIGEFDVEACKRVVAICSEEVSA